MLAKKIFGHLQAPTPVAKQDNIAGEHKENEENEEHEEPRYMTMPISKLTPAEKEKRAACFDQEVKMRQNASARSATPTRPRNAMMTMH